uniref:NADH dehydrogenase subunit 4 n=1 Tax=Parascaris univalens TaxID=6257 RepID=A0A915AMX6_PARUN
MAYTFVQSDDDEHIHNTGRNMAYFYIGLILVLLNFPVSYAAIRNDDLRIRY